MEKRGGKNLVLVGTYRPENAAWIRERRLYNLPIAATSATGFFVELLRADCPFPPPKNPKFTFIDLFAGIGGFHQAMHRLSGKCVFACEWEREAQNTYAENYGIVPAGDITKVDERNIPKHDVLCAGFPCQAFSKAGKQLGKDDTPLSYASRMKHSIDVNRMDVHEINADTLPYLSVFNPSPCEGKPHRPKYLIPHKMKEFLRIYEKTQGAASHL